MGTLGSGSTLDHLRFEVKVAAAHAARRPALRAAKIRLEARRAALAEAEELESWRDAARAAGVPIVE